MEGAEDRLPRISGMPDGAGDPERAPALGAAASPNPAAALLKMRVGVRDLQRDSCQVAGALPRGGAGPLGRAGAVKMLLTGPVQEAGALELLTGPA
jgi:hypothetical protein